jgi:hypothetical protein
MSFHLHWLPGLPNHKGKVDRGRVGRYVHDHPEPSQSHFYTGDYPISMPLIGSYPRWPRYLPDGRRNTTTHLRFPDDFGDYVILCGVRPASLSSRNGEVTCSRCLLLIHSMDDLQRDVSMYRQKVGGEEMDRAMGFLRARQGLESLDKVRSQAIETMLHGPGSISPTASPRQGIGW